MMQKNSFTGSLFKDNPLIRRYRFSVLRVSQLWIYLTIYACVVLLILFLNFSVYSLKTNAVPGEVFFTLYCWFILLQISVLLIWSTINSAAAIPTELSEKTYDFFRLVPLSAMQKIMGILIGRNLLVLIMAGLNFLFILVFGALGGVSFDIQFQIILLFISVCLFSNSLMLVLSSQHVRKRRRGSKPIFVIIFLLFIFGSPLINLAFTAFNEFEEIGDYLIRFYGIGIPVLVFISLVCLYLSFWNILGTVRKFTLEGESLFSKTGAVVFLVLYEGIVLGLLAPYVSSNRLIMIYPFWISTFVCLVVVSLGSLKSYYGYMEGFSRYLKRRGNKASLGRRLVFDSNLSLFVLMSVIWSFFALLVVYLYQRPVMGFLSGLAVLLTFYLFAVLLMETYVVYMPINNKIHFLLGFAAGLELILPMILSWIF
ncbi:MAG: hypothetical protein ACYTE8_08330, partial [Planctomycetota bacterium]